VGGEIVDLRGELTSGEEEFGKGFAVGEEEGTKGSDFCRVGVAGWRVKVTVDCS